MAEDQSLKFRARLDRQGKITLNFQQPTVISLGIEELSGTAQLVNTVPNGGGAYPLLLNKMGWIIGAPSKRRIKGRLSVTEESD